MTENGKKLQARVYDEDQVRIALERKDPDMLLAAAAGLCPELCKGRAVLLEPDDADTDLITVFVSSTEESYAFPRSLIIALAIEFYLETGSVCEILRQLKD